MDELRVLCVKCDGSVETRKLLEEAHKCLREEKMAPVLFTEEQCFDMTEKMKNTIFIFEKFEGAAYKHIADLGFRIYGPLCIVTCLACKQNIPRRNRPIYNLAMKDIIVCFTNITTADREMLYEKVELMGGEYRKGFTDDTTHLVAGSVGSQKYWVAAEKTCSIMLPDWVNTVWDQSQLHPVHGLDEKFQELKCPIFYGHVITVSGLSPSERTEAKRLIEKEGGVYTGDMTVNTCTHLIVNEPKGTKYRHALKWRMNIVRCEWLYESIEKGYCQNEAHFPVDPGETVTAGNMHTSTPERRSMANGGISDLSNISMISMANINETANVTNMTTRLDHDDPTENLDMTKIPAEMFLDGCKVYLSGFRGATLEKLRKIINSGGGTRFNQISDNLTHIVVGEKISRDHELIQALTTRPQIVSCQWLVECYRQERLVEEVIYTSTQVQPRNTTPTSKGKGKKPRASKANEEKPSTSKQPDDGGADDMQDIMSQYLHNHDNDETTTNDTTVAPPEDASADDDDDDDDLTQDPNTPTGDVKILEKKTFVFYGFEEEPVAVFSVYIKENGGKVIKTNARQIPDYAVVPIDGFPVDRTVNHIVTKCWLIMCIEQTQLLDVHSNPLFTPLEINIDNLPMKNCVISLSGYAGTERDSLVDIAEALGATCQDYFVRKARPNLLPSTHLIVNAPEGSKFDAAKKWGIPAMSKLWILACAKSGKQEDVDRYLIENVPDDNTMLPETDNQSKLDQTSDIENQSKPKNGDNNVNQSIIITNKKESSSDNKSANVDKQKQNEVDISIESKTERRSNIGHETVNGPDFSATGDTEAMMAGINTQGEQIEAAVDNDETVGAINDRSHESDGIPENIPNNVNTNMQTPVSTRTISATEDLTDIRQAGSEGHASKPSNKHIAGVKTDLGSAERVGTPALTRFMRNLEKNPPPTGTPALCKYSAVEKLAGKALNKNVKAVREKIPANSTDTPPLRRFMKNLEKNPPQTGTPVLTKQSARDKLRNMPARFVDWKMEEKMMENSSASQKENLVAMATPVQSRLKELKIQEGSKTDKDTPSKFLNPNVRYIPKFDTEEMLECLKTPEDVRAARAKKRESLYFGCPIGQPQWEKVVALTINYLLKLRDNYYFSRHKLKTGMSCEELYDVYMNKAMTTVETMREQREQGYLLSQKSQDDVDGDLEESTALQGVIITVAKKLAKDQSELNDIVTSLGGDYRWNYDSSCTHFIFQGRQNDTARDFKQAKSQGLKIVSPHWLYMCKEQNVKVDESLFPHTFNPNLSLSVVATRRTPMRTPRSTRRTARANSKTDNIPPPTRETIVITEEDAGKSGEKGSNCDMKTVKGSDSVIKKLSDEMKSPERSSSDDENKGLPMETGGSLEMREVLSRQLEDVMAESKGKKRRKSKKLNCSGHIGTPDEPTSSNTSRTRRPEDTAGKISSSRASRNLGTAKSTEEKNSAEMAPSQSVHVVWDDPMGRLEQEKLAHKLERANSPTQDVGAMYDLDPENAQYSESDGETEHPVPQFVEQQQVQEKTTPKHVQPSSGKTPTPEGPSIAFPKMNTSKKVTPPKPVLVEDEETDGKHTKSPPVFIMSGLDHAERDNYAALVEQLGGKVSDSQQYDESCTHLVINKVTRNEKFLSSLAAGKWVLHKSYFDACREEQKFVKEDFYEWGNEGTMSLVSNMENNVRLLAAAARDWRIKIQQAKLTSPHSSGAFSSWRVILVCDTNRAGSFSRLLSAGGATVLNIKSPVPARIDATHALMDLNKVPVPQEDLENLLSNGCLCLKPDYISGYLCNPDVSVTDYIPPEVLALQTVMSDSAPSGRKRKCSTNDVTQKRSKRR